jgi:hypothetical protein
LVELVLHAISAFSSVTVVTKIPHSSVTILLYAGKGTQFIGAGPSLNVEGCSDGKEVSARMGLKGALPCPQQSWLCAISSTQELRNDRGMS